MNKNYATKELVVSLRRLTRVHQIKVLVNRVGTYTETRTGTVSSIRKEGGRESQAPNLVED